LRRSGRPGHSSRHVCGCAGGTALASHVLVLLIALTMLLFAARLLAVVARRVGMPAITGELLAGIILGPSLFGSIAPGPAHWLVPISRPEQMHLVDAIGQLGVLLLVGITGTHLDLNLLRRRGAPRWR
jgi:Kef-type K+ transport system membrane component KefB